MEPGPRYLRLVLYMRAMSANALYGHSSKYEKTYKNEQVRQYQRLVQSALQTVNVDSIKWEKSEPVQIAARFWFCDRKDPDLDNCLKPFIDAVQSSGVIHNDKQVLRIEAEKFPACGRDAIEFILSDFVPCYVLPPPSVSAPGPRPSAP